jgi:steroid 5-alpha reductase family enzyme
MFRLSYNTYRRGLFSLHDEDYRWAVLRTQLPPWLFQVVNLTFIAATQNVLLLTLGYPAYLALIQNDTKLAATDVFFGTWALGVLLVEFTADNQQFVYQTYKYAFLDNLKKKSESEAQAHSHALSTAAAVAWPFAFPSPSSTFHINLNLTPADAHRGFLTKGLWAYSRHPNFACEQTFWWLICLIPVSAHQYPLVGFTWADLMGLGKSQDAGNAKTVVSVFGQRVFEPLAAFVEVILWALREIGFDFASASSSSAPTYFDSTNLSPKANESLSLLTGVFPAILLTILFFSSTAYTENISKGKYPTAYAAYQKRVPMFGQTPVLGLVIALLGFVMSPVIVVWGLEDAAGLVMPLVRPLVDGMEWLNVGWWWYWMMNGVWEKRRVERLVWGEVRGDE